MKAIDKFIANLASSQEMLDKIQDHINRRLDKHPDKINWPDVGDANRLLCDLMEIVEYLQG